MRKIQNAIFAALILCAAIISCAQPSSSSPQYSQGYDAVIEGFKDPSFKPEVNFYKYSAGGWLRANPVDSTNPGKMYMEDGSGFGWYENFKRNCNEPAYKKLFQFYNSTSYYQNINLYKSHLEAINSCDTYEKALREFESIVNDSLYNQYEVTGIKTIEGRNSYVLGNKYFGLTNEQNNKYKKYTDSFESGASIPTGKNKNLHTAITDYISQMGLQLDFSNIITGFRTFNTTYVDSNIFSDTYIFSSNMQALNTYTHTTILNKMGIENSDFDNGSISESFDTLIQAIYTEPTTGQDQKLDSFKDFLRFIVLTSCINDTELKENVPEDFYTINLYYINERYTTEIENKVIELYNRIKEAFKKRIESDDSWLSDNGKSVALEKLSLMKFYPGRPSDMTKYIIVPNSAWTNYDYAIKDFEKQKIQRFLALAKAAQSNDDYYIETYMNDPAFIPNGFYAPVFNAFTITPGMACSYQFNINRDPAYNFGSLGTIIGHEITHGFDTEGCKHKPDGTEYPEGQSLLSQEDKDTFNQKTNGVKNYYDQIKYTAAGDLVSGEQTLAENIADLGGIAIAYDALKEYYKDLSPEQFREKEERFFQAFALGTLDNQTEDLRKQGVTKGDEHCPGNVRPNAILSQFTPWQNRYGKSNAEQDEYHNNWYVAPEDRIVIW